MIRAPHIHQLGAHNQDVQNCSASVAEVLADTGRGGDLLADLNAPQLLGVDMGTGGVVKLRWLGYASQLSHTAASRQTHASPKEFLSCNQPTYNR